MQLLYKILGFQGLHSAKYGLQYGWEGLWLFIASGFGFAVLIEQVEQDMWWVAYTVLLLCVLYLAWAALRTGILAHRLRQHKERAVAYVAPHRWYMDTALVRQYGQNMARKSTETVTLELGGYWGMYDLVINVWRETRLGDFVGRRHMHTVFESKLQRQVPNVVFDNREAHGRQFSYQYVGAQRLSLEGDFDRYFDTYGPQGYHVDTLSFISPEVMAAMRDCTIPCDIEFVGDRLICHAPMVTAADIDAYKQQCLRIYAAVNDNLDIYRDDRLSGVARQQSVTPFARQLLENPLSQWPILFMSGLGSVLIVGFAVKVQSMDIILNQISMYVLIIFGYQASRVYKIARKNKRALAARQ